jgi:hypothetical protein
MSLLPIIVFAALFTIPITIGIAHATQWNFRAPVKAIEHLFWKRMFEQ